MAIVCTCCDFRKARSQATRICMYAMTRTVLGGRGYDIKDVVEAKKINLQTKNKSEL